MLAFDVESVAQYIESKCWCYEFMLTAVKELFQAGLAENYLETEIPQK